MKKLLLTLASVALVSASAMAAPGNPQGGWYAGIGGGIDVPAQNWNSAYKMGVGGEVLGGYRIDHNWAVQLEVDGMAYPDVSPTVYNVQPALEAKYSFDLPGLKDIQPYALLGPAANFQFTSGSSSTTNLSAKGGVGVQLNLDNQTDLFVQGKYHVMFPNNANGPMVQDIPVEAGVIFSL